MRHPFMTSISERLALRGVMTLRYEFAYMEAGRRRPDPPGVLVATIRRAVRTAMEAEPNLPLFAGGKSMGGRMTSQAAGKGGLKDVRGLVFFGFPLHPAGRPSTDRAAHLREVRLPMLFLQGTRDALASLELLRPICEDLGSDACLHVLEGADHSFRMLKRSGRTHEDALDELAEVTATWMEGVLQSS